MALHDMRMCGVHTRSSIKKQHMYVSHHLRGHLKSPMPCTIAQALLHPDKRVAV